MIYYFDTSALVKIYHTESGSATVQPIYRGTDEIIISELGKIECLSTVSRKYREREITRDTLLAVITKFEADLQHRYTVLRFSLLVINEAWDLLRRYAETRGLKTLDSLQLAFCTIYCDTTTQFVCADATLGDVVQQEGYHILILIQVKFRGRLQLLLNKVFAGLPGTAECVLFSRQYNKRNVGSLV